AGVCKSAISRKCSRNVSGTHVGRTGSVASTVLRTNRMFYGVVEGADWRAFQHFDPFREIVENRRCNTSSRKVRVLIYSVGVLCRYRSWLICTWKPGGRRITLTHNARHIDARP